MRYLRFVLLFCILSVSLSVSAFAATVSVRCYDCGNEVLLEAEQFCSTYQIDFYCPYCDSGAATGFVSGLGHSYTTSSSAATCENAGWSKTYCIRCGVVTSSQTIAALGHSYSPAVISSPSCTAEGVTRYTCDRSGCGKFYDDISPALGHILSDSIVDATCLTAGSKTSSCSRCDYALVETIAALGHSTTITVVDATCVSDGSKVTTCSRCDYSASETIAKFGHDWEETSRIEPTYTSEGSIVSTCTRCQDTMTESIPALESDSCIHSWVETGRIDPTYTTTGQVDYECSLCGSSMSETLPVLDPDACVHQFVQESVVDATYDADGMITYRCSSCGSSKVVRIPMLTPDSGEGSILTELKLAFQSLFGVYQPVMTTHVTVTSSAAEVSQVLTTGVADGAAGIDYEYLAGVFLFSLLLYCVLRLFGGVMKSWRT